MSAYLDNARRVLKQAEKIAETYKGDCSQCRWSIWDPIDRMCSNPVVKLAAKTIDQESREYLMECDSQRAKQSYWGPVVCGPDGDLFEPGLSKENSIILTVLVGVPLMVILLILALLA